MSKKDSGKGKEKADDKSKESKDDKKTTKTTKSKESDKKKEDKVVFFKVGDLEKMKRKRLQSLAKRIGEQGNKNNEYLRAKLKEYYEAHKADMEVQEKALAKKKEETAKNKKKPRQTELDKLKSNIHYPDTSKY
eukprot:TRINITY_DN22806_c0_g1_i1.p1 TRINITY_DN22806_c0_g1~~TRINITY_DN22806_c0_g1_i1.p1  ORF type:complete len:134 (-),score=50.45 TRINITY_DN22806_c0_g1_i1:90-491(-)